MEDIFALMAEFLLLKSRQLQLLQGKLKDEQGLLEELRVCKDLARVKELVAALQKANSEEIQQLS